MGWPHRLPAFQVQPLAALWRLAKASKLQPSPQAQRSRRLTIRSRWLAKASKPQPSPQVQRRRRLTIGSRRLTIRRRRLTIRRRPLTTRSRQLRISRGELNIRPCNSHLGLCCPGLTRSHFARLVARVAGSNRAALRPAGRKNHRSRMGLVWRIRVHCVGRYCGIRCSFGSKR